MILNHTDTQTGGTIQFIFDEQIINAQSFREEDKGLLTILWNRGKEQIIAVDDLQLGIGNDEIAIFNTNQTFAIPNPQEVVAWRFNRDFYCIIDHDAEVSCVGLLFYGHKTAPTIALNSEDLKSLELLVEVFKDEYGEPEDNLKTEMLRVILKRLIVKLTRIYKKQTELAALPENEMDLIRNFNLLVETHFKEYHQVQDYANIIHKSPKTISNVFSKYSEKSPLEVIHERVILEAKRLLIYTDRSAKEIAFELGFSDIPNFSRFFKKNLSISPSQFRSAHKTNIIRNN